MRLVGAASKDINLWHEIVVITISACSDDRDVDVDVDVGTPDSGDNN